MKSVRDHLALGRPFPFSSNSSTYPEKLSAYECGFDPSGDARSRFDMVLLLPRALRNRSDHIDIPSTQQRSSKGSRRPTKARKPGSFRK